MRPLIGAAKLNGAFAIQTGSLTCSLKMTSGQPLPVRFQSWILVCIVVAPLPSPSKVTIFTCTSGCALTYAWTIELFGSYGNAESYEPAIFQVPGANRPSEPNSLMWLLPAACSCWPNAWACGASCHGM